ncbi:MAG: HesA/MoeB/ThiF family protein [Bacteroidales bacterium]|nr:HesA/MoeB/ThiF family protein [Bacteroidales bacterium]MDT8373074.1 HesA/MoeB/ThiF family protein [Bacteroidales bacterium]
MLKNAILSENEAERYSRQIRLPEIGVSGQLKLKNASVLVVGAGGLGCPVIQYLTAAGVGILGIVDNDSVDESNLQRQVLYSIDDISKPKPVAAKDKLARLNPEVKINVHFLRLNKGTALDIITGYDIVVDCSDNFATRYLINDACVLLDKPLIYGAVQRFSGQVTVLNYNTGPTLRCIHPVPPHPLETASCEEEGVLGSVAGIVGTMQATEVIKLITGAGDILSGRMFVIDTLNYSTQVVSFGRDPEHSSITGLGDYDDQCLSDSEPVTEVTADELRTMISSHPGLKVIDLREEDENSDIGFVCVRIPYSGISQRLHTLPADGPLVFYCRYGVKSRNVIVYLRNHHKMEHLYNLVL